MKTVAEFHRGNIVCLMDTIDNQRTCPHWEPDIYPDGLPVCRFNMDTSPHRITDQCFCPEVRLLVTPKEAPNER